MGFMFCDLQVSLNNPSSWDIISSNLPCLLLKILPNFEPIQDFIAVPATCKNEDGPIKNEGA